jgi:small-conductance mechanosensitive channel
MEKIFKNIIVFFEEYFLSNIRLYFESKNYIVIIKLILFTIISIIVLKLLLKFLRKILGKKIIHQTKEIILSFIKYTGWAIIIATIFKKLGIDLTPVLGAAGIIGIAIGFAAQTSFSNVISGFFLISEKPFEVGDIIKVNNVVGIVDKIDFMSVKIKTFDNQMVRVPNETLIKTEITNITKYDIRRLDIIIEVEYGTDLKKLENILFEKCKRNVYILDTPNPLFIVDSFSQSGIKILFGVYFNKNNYVKTKNSIMNDITKIFTEEDLKFAFQTVKILNENKF